MLSAHQTIWENNLQNGCLNIITEVWVPHYILFSYLNKKLDQMFGEIDIITKEIVAHNRKGRALNPLLYLLYHCEM